MVGSNYNMQGNKLIRWGKSSGAIAIQINQMGESLLKLNNIGGWFLMNLSMGWWGSHYHFTVIKFLTWGAGWESIPGGMVGDPCHHNYHDCMGWWWGYVITVFVICRGCLTMIGGSPPPPKYTIKFDGLISVTIITLYVCLLFLHSV